MPAQLRVEDAQVQNAIKDLVNHADQMNLTAKNVAQLRDLIGVTMDSHAGDTLRDKVDAWNANYKFIETKVLNVIDALGSTRKQFDAAEADNAALAAKFGEDAYNTLMPGNDISGSRNWSSS